MTKQKPVINYQGYPVVYSKTSNCSQDVIQNGTKYSSVFDVTGDYYTAIDTLAKEQQKLTESKFGRYHEYSSYILQTDSDKFEIHMKFYYVPN